MSAEEQKESVVRYPIREPGTKESNWKDPKFRAAWNKAYRQQVKDGQRDVTKRSKNSKWNDREFRKQYDRARRRALGAKERVLRVKEPKPKRAYSAAEKEDILADMLDKIRKGEPYEHPYLQLALTVRPQFKRPYQRKKESS